VRKRKEEKEEETDKGEKDSGIFLHMLSKLLWREDM
jgi:hypothetical protein